MFRPNLVDTTKCPESGCTWTLAVCAPPKLLTFPRLSVRWPAFPPERAAPSGWLTKLTEIVPCVSDRMETAVEVRLPEPLLCACPSVTREEPSSNIGKSTRSPMSHLQPALNPSFHLKPGLLYEN